MAEVFLDGDSTSVARVTLTGAGRTNGQNVNIRGYDQYGVLILIDGIRQGINGPHFNGIFLDPALIKKVSIIRSPSTTLLGSGALGGVIAYQTVDAADLLALRLAIRGSRARLL